MLHTKCSCLGGIRHAEKLLGCGEALQVLLHQVGGGDGAEGG